MEKLGEDERQWKEVAFQREFSGIGPIPEIDGLRPFEVEAFKLLFPQSHMDKKFTINGRVSSYCLRPGAWETPVEYLDVFFRYRVGKDKTWQYALVMRGEDGEFFGPDIEWLIPQDNGKTIKIELCTNEWSERKHLRFTFPSGLVETGYYNEEAKGYTIAG